MNFLPPRWYTHIHPKSWTVKAPWKKFQNFKRFPKKSILKKDHFSGWNNPNFRGVFFHKKNTQPIAEDRNKHNIKIHQLEKTKTKPPELRNCEAAGKRWATIFKNRGTPKSSHFNRVFHYKPSILGYPYSSESTSRIWFLIWPQKLKERNPFPTVEAGSNLTRGLRNAGPFLVRQPGSKWEMVIQGVFF